MVSSYLLSLRSPRQPIIKNRVFLHCHCALMLLFMLSDNWRRIAAPPLGAYQRLFCHAVSRTSQTLGGIR